MHNLMNVVSLYEFGTSKFKEGEPNARPLERLPIERFLTQRLDDLLTSSPVSGWQEYNNT